MAVKLFLQCLGTFFLSTLIFAFASFLFEGYTSDKFKDLLFSFIGVCCKILAICFMGFLVYAIWFIR